MLCRPQSLSTFDLDEYLIKYLPLQVTQCSPVEQIFTAKKNSKSAFLDSVEKWSMVLSQGVVGTFELATLLFLVLVLVFPSSNVRASFQRSRPELLGILPLLSHLVEQLYYRVYSVMFYQKPEAPKNPLARFNPNRNSNRKTYFF